MTTNNLDTDYLLINDVVSFDVRLLVAGGTDFVDLFTSPLADYVDTTHPTYGSSSGPRLLIPGRR